MSRNDINELERPWELADEALFIWEEIHEDLSLSGMSWGFVFVLISAPRGTLSYQLEDTRIEL